MAACVVRCGKRPARVDADAGLGSDERIAAEAIIVACILDRLRIVREQRMRAERYVAGRLRGIEPGVALELLAILVDDAHERAIYRAF
ncbi:hypothetical protein [Burkholderia latens]|uniref:hypothetical protein n=1 Tax=Burkholderia latens TaxID=488446 RepID=UPI00158E7F02